MSTEDDLDNLPDFSFVENLNSQHSNSSFNSPVVSYLKLD